jgi:hypothetical protein
MEIAMNSQNLIAGVLLGVMIMSGASQAQEQPGQMSDEQMKAVTQYAQEMQACMAKIGQADILKMQDEGNAREAEVRKLCAAGQRDKAQAKAVAYSKELMAQPSVQQMQQCLKNIKKPPMAGEDTEASSISDFTDLDEHEHICDSLAKESDSPAEASNE